MHYSLLRAYRSFSQRLLLRWFNSSLPLRIQLVWYLYSAYCRFLLSGFGGLLRLQSGNIFFSKGLVFLPKCDISSSADRLRLINDYLSPYFSLDTESQYQELPRGNHPLVALFVFDCLQFWKEEIESIFGSRFSTYWIMVYHTRPASKASDPSSSFAWHYDEDPQDLKKIFIYLNDTTRENGAFRYLSKAHSRMLFNSGFISNNIDNRTRSQGLITKEIEGLSEWVESGGGSGFIFDNNIVHRGTHPATGYRTVISIEAIPSAKSFTLSNIQNSLCLPIDADYPRWPWKNKYF